MTSGPCELGPKDPGGLTRARTADAMRRPLGAYLRVNHKDLVAMHSALAEVGVLFASATVHQGWSQVDRKGAIPYPAPLSGGHAFAIVAYDDEGFWIQNSWGEDWAWAASPAFPTTTGWPMARTYGWRAWARRWCCG
jgi:hypothetical protein